MKKTILLLCSILLCQLSMAQQVTIPPVIKGVTVMVAFQDYPINDPVQAVDDLMNKQNYTGNGQIGSVRDYFYTQTSGKVTITSTVVKVTLSQTRAYYDANNVNYVDEAIDLVNQNYPAGFQGLTVDPSDGKLMHLNFITRSPGRSSTVGASEGKFFKNNTTGQIEISGGNTAFFGTTDPLIINVICHEMGHSVMSWTDYYRTAFSNLGYFCVMASAGTEAGPMPINPALRLQRGWIDNIIPVSGTVNQTYTLTANSYTSVHKYVNPNNSKEYLLFHAVRHAGYYQAVVGGNAVPEGLAIWYVDEETGYDSPLNPNNDNQYFIRLVQADNKDEMHDEFLAPADVRGDLEDLYGNANKSFPNGTPFRWKDGGEFGINITSISSPGVTMQFTVTQRPNTVVASSDIFGTIAPKGTLSVTSGQTKTFSLTPNPGYEVNTLKLDNSNVTAANPYTMPAISGTKTLAVSFKRKATQIAPPAAWQKTAIGSVNSSDFTANSGSTFYLETYDNNLGGGSDNFTFMYQALNGDGTYITHLANYNTLENQRAGLMVRESLQPDAAFSAIAKTDMSGAIVLQRAAAGGQVKENPNEYQDLHIYELHNWLKIVRSGDQLVSYVSKDAVTWYMIGNQSITMPSQIYVGIFAKGNGYTSYPAQALFDNISFTSDPFPTVSITSPVTNTTYTANTVTINAGATPSVASGSITKVDFYDNTTLIGSDNSAPYSFVWNNVSGGIHAIVAKATDNTGKVAVSTKVIIVTPCTSGDPKIQGTIIGTTGSWNNTGNTREKAFDGDINTYFDANQSVAWTGLALTSAQKVTSIRYVPRQGLEGRMIGGKFQGSNDANFSAYTDLATIVAKPAFGWNCFDVANTTAFTYLRYIGPEDGVGNISELEFYGSASGTNKNPTVVITSPENGANYIYPAPITINATAADADGTIAKVEFYAGTNLLRIDSIYPYSHTISNLPSGTYSFTAKAYDNLGASAAFTVSNIVVIYNTSPTVTITSPVANASYTAPANIIINADASDADGSIWKVEFYNGSTWLASDFTAPYSYTWSNVPAGTYNITALAIDNVGGNASYTRTNIVVKGNVAPTVSVTSPLTNASYTAPATIVITADAADADGTIAKVEFYNGSTLLGSDLTAPYSYTWNNVPAGVYNITALTVDNLGAAASSTRNNIAVTAPVADIFGPACAANNTTITYELAASKRVNATGYGWYFTGSTQSFTPSSTTPYQATLVTGNNYAQGQLCVGVSFASAPYYVTYCITLPKCSVSREAGIEEEQAVALQPVGFPNPFKEQTTINLENATQDANVQVYNASGVLVKDAAAKGTFTFGEDLVSGIYFVKIITDNKTQTLKLVKE